MPAPTAAWRAGFWPSPALRIWPMMTSLTSPGSTPARRIASLIATSPNLCAARLASPPLKAPTGVRAALAMTTSVMRGLLAANAYVGGQRVSKRGDSEKSRRGNAREPSRPMRSAFGAAAFAARPRLLLGPFERCEPAFELIHTARERGHSIRLATCGRGRACRHAERSEERRPGRERGALRLLSRAGTG